MIEKGVNKKQGDSGKGKCCCCVSTIIVIALLSVGAFICRDEILNGISKFKNNEGLDAESSTSDDNNYAASGKNKFTSHDEGIDELDLTTIQNESDDDYRNKEREYDYTWEENTDNYDTDDETTQSIRLDGPSHGLPSISIIGSSETTSDSHETFSDSDESVENNNVPYPNLINDTMESSTEDPNAEWIQNITTTTMSTTLATSTIIPVPETTFYDGSGSGDTQKSSKGKINNAPTDDEDYNNDESST